MLHHSHECYTPSFADLDGQDWGRSSCCVKARSCLIIAARPAQLNSGRSRVAALLSTGKLQRRVPIQAVASRTNTAERLLLNQLETYMNFDTILDILKKQLTNESLDDTNKVKQFLLHCNAYETKLFYMDRKQLLYISLYLLFHILDICTAHK